MKSTKTLLLKIVQGCIEGNIMKINRTKNLRAQIQIGESIIVLILFLFLLVFGVVVYTKVQQFTGKQEQREQKEDISMQMEQKIRFLQELQCTAQGIARFDCYDLAKLKAFTATYQEYKLYYNTMIFPHAKVSIAAVFPDQAEFVLYEDAALADQATTATPFRTPLLIYNPIDDSYNFGYITVEVYQ